MNYNEETDDPRTLEEAEANGMVHFWTEVDVDGKTYILDPAQETHDAMGSPLVTTELPEEYIRPENCRFVYHESIHHRNLRNEEGYEYLVEEGHLDDGEK